MSIKEELLQILEQMGCVVVEKEEDFELADYICDSILFVQFLTTIEDHFQMEIPDELMNYEILQSFVGFANVIEEIVEKSNRCGIES